MIDQIEVTLQQLEAGYVEEALIKLQQQLQHKDTSDELRFEVAEFLFERGFVEEALPIMEELVDSYTQEYELVFLYAEMLMEADREDEALSLLHKIIEIFHTESVEHVDLGVEEKADVYLRAIILSTEISIMQGLFEAAEHKVKQALQRYPEEKVLHSALGEIYYYQENYALAVTNYQRGNLYSSYAKIADCYAHLGKYEESLTYYNKAVEEYDNVDVLWGHAMVLAQLKQLEEAVTKLEKLLDLDPYYTSAYPLLVDMYKQLGQAEQAYEIAQNGLKFDQTNPFLYYVLAEIYEAKQQGSKAIEAYKEALALDDHYVPALERLSELMIEEEAWQESMRYLNVLIDIIPERAKLHQLLGSVYEGLEEWQKAEQSYREALRIDPEDAETINKLAFLVRDEGRLDEAISLWKKSLIINSDQEDIEQILREYE